MTNMTHDRQLTSTAAVDIGGLITRGMAAGTTAGLGFILANMWYAAHSGKPPVAPFLAISTVFHGSDAPVMAAPAVPGEVVTGLVLHLALSIAFGVGFAVLVLLVPMLRSPGVLVAGALLYGLGLYVLNFQILGRTVFPFFTNPAGPNQLFEVIVHPVIFGLMLVPFFVGWSRR